MVEIVDQTSARAWLETKGHQMRIRFAARCALRGLPGIGFWPEAVESDFAFASFRAAFITTAVATCETNDFRDLSKIATARRALSKSAPSSSRQSQIAIYAGDGLIFALDAAAKSDAAVECAVGALRCSAAVAGSQTDGTETASIRQAAFSAASMDANTSMDMERRALWGDETTPEVLIRGWSALKQQWQDTADDWSFWIEWYEAVLDGKWKDRDLIFEIATQLDDADWDKGPAHVAEQIKLIRRSYRTSVSTRLIRLEIGKWDVEQDADIPAEPIEFAIAQVEIALAAALATDQGNGLSETSGETILIRKAGSDFKSLPSAVATSYWNACMGLQRNLGNLYPEDAPLIALQNVLYTSVEELCAQDPLIRDRVAKLAALETRRMPTTQEREDLQQVPDLVAEDLTAPALEQLSDAVDAVSTTERPARFWRAKLVNWLNTLGRGLDQAQKNEKRAMWLLKLAHRISGWFFDGDE